MKKVVLCLTVAALAVGGTILPELEGILATTGPDEMVNVIIQTRLQADLRQLPPSVSYDRKIDYLKSTAARAQREILAWLETTDAQNVRTFWTSSRIALSARPEVIRALAARPDVDFVIDDFTVTLAVEPGWTPAAHPDAEEWNITIVSAPDCWDDGYDGTGIVVGNIDTGVLVTHEALNGRWRSTDGWFDAVNDSVNPYDDHNHGTHCMGSTLGTHGIGVAPGATFIAAKAFNSAGSGDASWIQASIDWMADTGRPDVLSNSWGSSSRTSSYWFDPFNNLRDLGIVVVVSIGNNGPNAETSTPPGSFPIVIGVGATNSSDAIWSSSSRGPAPNQAPWNNSDYWPRPDWDLTNPVIAAPGASVRSALRNGGYGLMSGTSMACPHVAGAAALLLQKKPDLTHADIFDFLIDNVDEPSGGAPYPNNNFGWGRLNCWTALDAVEILPSAPTPEAPDDGSDVATLTPSLEVAAITGATHYQFRVFENGSEVANSGESHTGRTWTVDPPLENGKSYTWESRVRNNAGWGPYFDPRWRFSVVILPSAPTPEAPDDESELTTLTPDLTVAAVSGATHYQFRVLENGSEVANSGEGHTGRTWTVDPALENGKSYTWESRARNVAGWGPYFDPRWRFSVVILPSAPTPEAPDDDSDVATLTPDLTVAAVSGATHYQFRVLENGSEVANSGESHTGRTWTVDPALEEDKTYTWESRARNVAGWGPYFDPRWRFTVVTLPSAPTPEAPDDDSDVATLTPDLTVAAIAGATHYQFRVFENGSEVANSGESHTGRTWTVDPPLEEDKTYTWESRARNNAGWGPYFDPRWRFTVVTLPSAPTPEAPDDDSDVATLTPELTVAAVAGATHYQFRVFENGSEVANSGESHTGRTWTVDPALENGESYTWESRVRNSAGWGPYFDPRWRFTVSVLPGAFALSAPTDGALDQPLVGDLEWAEAEHATSYDVYFGTEAEPPFVENVTGLVWSYTGEQHTDYYWTVTARNVAGETETGSGVWTFRTELTDRPTLIAPTDGDTINTQRPEFAWTDLGDGITYDIEIDADDEFPAPAYGATGVAVSTWSPEEDIPEGQWFWRVRAVGDEPGPWSDPFFEFGVDITPPAVPELSYPIGGELVETTLPSFDWEPVEDARQFELEVYDDTAALVMSRTIIQAEGEDESEYVLEPGEELPDSAGYTWRVEARDYAGNSSGFAADEEFRVEVFVMRDVGVTAVLKPSGRVYTGSEIFPQVTVENFGEAVETFMVELVIRDLGGYIVFEAETEVVGLEVGANRDVTFVDQPWEANPVGKYHVTAATRLEVDMEPGNDELGPVSFAVTRVIWPAGWQEVTPVPGLPGNRRDVVLRGGWLAVNDNLVYATKGNKLQDFLVYDPETNQWRQLASVPTANGRLLERGCRGIADGENTIYVIHGNNTLAFWSYDISADTWTRLSDAPEGPSGRRVRGGGDLARVELNGVGYIYMLKGDRSDFARYNPVSGGWEPRTPAPDRRFRRDSWLVADGAGILYLHQARTHGFWRYDAAADTWSGPMTGMPPVGDHGGRPRTRRARDGSSATLGDDGRIYALKGGNTTMFYSFDPGENTWQELPGLPREGSSPRLRRVNAGGDIVHFGDGVFYALKGNRTNELWRFVVPGDLTAPRPERSGVMAGATPAGLPFVKVGPNPLTGSHATVQFGGLGDNIPRLTVSVYDVSGRNVLSRGMTAARAGAVSLDLRSLSAGIYLIQVEADGFSGTHKLVVQR